MEKDVVVYVEDMLDALVQVASYVHGMTYDDFFDDREKQDAVFRCLTVLGEAAKHIPEHIRSQHGDIPWRMIAGMRDKLVHDYSGIRVDLIWGTIRDDLPKLKESARASQGVARAMSVVNRKGVRSPFRCTFSEAPTNPTGTSSALPRRT